ncbi:MAG TPA: hypothetical protein VI875_00745 [Candidatus Norongarragalinales archaeon]|nr:hypothetical protein [Candidatus Norongarragalinales archaeon]
MKLLMAAAFLALLSPYAFAYVDQTFSIYAKALENGNARITEKTVFFLENDLEKEAFDYYLRLGQTTLLDWKRFSKSIGYHFSGKVSNLRIVAKHEFETHPNAASVTLEYDAEEIMQMQQFSSRATKYTLNTPLIALISSKGEISLGNSMSFTLEVPRDSQEITVSPDPGVLREKNVITWTGPIHGKWDVEFTREKSLSDEVNEFFAKSVGDLQKNYFWVLLLAFALVVAVKFMQKPEENGK